MLHIRICEDLDIRTQGLTITKGLVRRPFDQSLVRDSRAGVNIRSDELAPYCRRYRERTRRIVPQNVDAKRQIHLAPDLTREGCHEGDGMGRYSPRIKRNVAEILDYQSIHTAGRQRFGILQYPMDDGFEIERVSW